MNEDDISPTIYQYSIVSALMDGQTVGGIQLQHLRKRGDFGLGTLELADGEMILVDGTAYHMKHDGSTKVVQPDTCLPYAMTTIFKPTISKTVECLSKDAFHKFIEVLTPTAGNYFLAIRCEGRVKKIKVRVAKGQNVPGERVMETIKKTQRVIYMEDVEGTFIGFRSPDCYQGISVAGYHLHFINKERTAGGHCLDFDIDRGKVEVSIIRKYYTELPDTDEFYKADLSLNSEGIVQAEGK
ncbi:hypothetical protein Unana1_02544 [Umbelopsis nana]